jgi:predicted RNA binding protein YcfA (HicA-like mRNA interferase family)
MTRCEKLLQKAQNQPRGLRFEELLRLAECYGFRFTRQRGSHRQYRHDELGVSIPLQPDKNGKAKEYQVGQVLGYIHTLLEDE